jgi:glycosyltransferase involved in cell wall biosynthesis
MLSLIKKQIPRAQRVVSLSRDMSVDLERLGVPADRIDIIPNAVDHARFSAPVDRAALRRVHGISPEAFVFLCVARNHPQKDLPTLLRAFKKACLDASGKRLHLVIVGRGVPDLRANATTLGLVDSITLLEIHSTTSSSGLPEYPPQALVEIYRAADAFVLSSLLEGFSTALLEAMASSLPVVATRVPGIVDQVEDGREGLLVSEKNPNDLGDALRKIACDPELASRLSIQAGRRSMEFHWGSVAKKYLVTYQKMISEAKSSKH